MQALEFRFAFFARDFDQSVGFYRDTLGLTLTDSWDRPDGKGALIAIPGTGAVIEIYGPPEGDVYDGPHPSTAINLAIRLGSISEVDARYSQLAAAGVVDSGPPKDHPWGHRSFVVRDPDGIQIHFYCEINPAASATGQGR